MARTSRGALTAAAVSISALVIAACGGASIDVGPGGVHLEAGGAGITVANPVPVNAWAADFREFDTLLRANHPDPGKVLASADWKEALERAVAGAPARDDHANFLEMQKLVGRLGDLHTMLAPTFTDLAKAPLRFAWLADGLYVVQATPAYRAQLGARVTAVDGKPIETVLALLRPVLGVANRANLEDQAARSMHMLELLKGAGVTSGDGATYALAMAGGASANVQVAASAETALVGLAGKTPFWLSQADKKYWWTELPGGVIYLRYAQCADDPSQPFAQVAAEMVAAANRTGGAARIVVDLRANGGGNSSVFTQALAAAGAQLAAPPRVVTLVSRGTYSSALINMFDTVKLAARVIGEVPGQPPNAPGEVLRFKLGRTGTTLSTSTRMFTLLPGAAGDSFQPAEVIERTAEDVRTGDDRVLARALAMLGA